MTVKTLNRSFAAGEISPQLFSRLDLDKFQTGVALCQNFIVTPQGPVQNRPGLQYIIETKYSNQPAALIPFSFSTQQTFALEVGVGYIRFHTQGATLLMPSFVLTAVTNAVTAVFSTLGAHGYVVGQEVFLGAVTGMPGLSNRYVIIQSVPSAGTFIAADLFGQTIDTSAMPAFTGGSVAAVFEVATPYAAADVFDIHYVQSADVLTLVHPSYAPQELRRLSATSWTLTPIQFSSALSPPQSNGVTPVGINHTYIVTPIFPDFPGTPSAATTCGNDFTVPGRFNAVNWQSVSGANNYLVYKLVGATYQYIGSSASSPTFIDDASVVPDPTVPFFSHAGATTVAVATAVGPSSDGLTVTPTGAGSVAYTYCVTSLNADASEESIASTPASASNSLSTAGQFNTVRWPTVAGVGLYNVYRKISGIFGFVGRAGSDATFVDANILPDTSITPPIQLNPFLGTGNYPRAVSYHQQRRVFGGTVNQPQNVWMTRSGTEKNLGYSFPSRDDDGITLRVVSREANTIRHMVPMGELILLTSGGEWELAAADSGALTPSNTSVKPQGYSGASNVQPVVTDRTILFAQDRGGHVRELQFSWQQQGYQTSDVTILAPHLFDYKTVKQMAFTRSPVAALWSVRSDGRLLSMTYVPEHEVRAWAQHVTDGNFESVCSIAEGDEDGLYCIVNRTINGTTKRYVERLHTRRFDTPADQFFVDCGATYAGVPVGTITGLYHLEGKTVSILADGGVSPPQVVVNGSVALDAPASTVQVGLPYVSRIQTLPLSIQTQAFGQGVVKNVNKVFLRVLSSNGFSAGPTFDKLRQYPTRFYEPYGSAPDLVTGEVPITLSPQWQRDGSVCVQQDQPLAMTLLGMALEVATGS